MIDSLVSKFKHYTSAKQSPVLFLFIVAATVFIAEALVMLLLNALPPLSDFIGAIVDASLLVILISPALYFFLLRPMNRQLHAIQQAEVTLKKNKEEQLRVMLQTTSEGFWITDDQGRFLEVNNSYSKMVGYSKEELLTMRISDVEAVEKPEETNQHIQKIIMTGSDQFETQHRSKDGRILDVEVSTNYSKIQGGRFYCFLRDISDRKRSDLLMQALFQEQKAMLESGLVGIAKIKNQVFSWTNPAYEKMMGYSKGELNGKSTSLIYPSDESYEALDLDAYPVLASGKIYRTQIEELRKDGSLVWLDISGTMLDVSKGESLWAFVDITEQKLAQEKVQQLAFYDPLTKLPNRQLLLDRLKRALAASFRSLRKGALLIIDLDNFKNINDTAGHDTGDLLLKQVADRLLACVQEGDTVARLGGDEFVILLEDLSEQENEAAEQVEVVGDKILTLLNQPYQLSSNEFRNSPSIGVVLFDANSAGIDNLLKQADIAMYQAKSAGKNTLKFFDPQIQAMMGVRQTLEQAMHNALELGQFHLYYQVQVNSAGTAKGAEVLIRWIHPELGLVSPTSFIPLAEECGMILPIGQWVLETACAQIHAWQRDALTRDLVLSVNVSAKQFNQANFVAQVQNAVNRHGISPNLLKLELTEGMLVSNIEDTIGKMGILNEIGIKFSLDDFGTGFSSLQYLKRLPLDQLKIDQSFVRDIASDANDQAIVSTIIGMSHSLGLNVIAEGVETEQQKEILLNSGCSSYQGYLFSKPVPIEEFYALLRTGRIA